MKTIRWCGYDWITQERWGQIHPKKNLWWYDESCVSVKRNNYLHLKTKYNPKYFVGIGEAPIGVGLVSCTEKFSFGTYSIKAKLPKGKNLWPAFWMWSWDSWPPEIDVFEAYTNSKGSYLKPNLKNPCGFWNVQTNVHYTKENKNKMIGSKTHYFGFKDPSEHFITYTLIWERDSISFFYDNRLVRKIKDKKILSQLSNTTMNVVINNGITEDAILNSSMIDESDFIIKEFRFSPIIYSF